jgi:translation initiation factor IF-3
MVIFPDSSKQLMDTAAALEAAKAHGLDLVEVNPRIKPPVAK